MKSCTNKYQSYYKIDRPDNESDWNIGSNPFEYDFDHRAYPHIKVGYLNDQAFHINCLINLG